MREMKRNIWPSAYLYTDEWALYFTRLRKRFKATKCPRKLTPELGLLIIALLKQRLSPEQISHYLKRHKHIEISHESIYRFIYNEPERKRTLKPFLRQGQRLRRKHYASGATSSLIPNRVSISQRSAIIDNKRRIGDWECDTLTGIDRKSALVTLVERKTLLTVSAKIARKNATSVAQAMIALLKPYQDKVKTLTFDNGSEFCQHEKVADALSAKTYFADPYSSWQRGLHSQTRHLKLTQI